MKKKGLVTAIVCIAMALVAYFAWLFVFFEYETNVYTTTAEQLFTIDHLTKLVPLLIIGLLTAIGIVACIVVRNHLMRRDTLRSPFATRYAPAPRVMCVAGAPPPLWWCAGPAWWASSCSWCSAASCSACATRGSASPSCRVPPTCRSSPRQAATISRISRSLPACR